MTILRFGSAFRSRMKYQHRPTYRNQNTFNCSLNSNCSNPTVAIRIEFHSQSQHTRQNHSFSVSFVTIWNYLYVSSLKYSICRLYTVRRSSLLSERGLFNLPSSLSDILLFSYVYMIIIKIKQIFSKLVDINLLALSCHCYKQISFTNSQLYFCISKPLNHRISDYYLITQVMGIYSRSLNTVGRINIFI